MRGEKASPLGIILYIGKNEEQIELRYMDQSDIHKAEYLAVLSAKE